MASYLSQWYLCVSVSRRYPLHHNTPIENDHCILQISRNSFVSKALSHLMIFHFTNIHLYITQGLRRSSETLVYTVYPLRICEPFTLKIDSHHKKLSFSIQSRHITSSFMCRVHKYVLLLSHLSSKASLLGA